MIIDFDSQNVDYSDIRSVKIALQVNETAIKALKVRQLTPYPQYKSGAKVQDNTLYTYEFSKKKNPVLPLEEDIIFSDGKGLRKGFYEVYPDFNRDYLILEQAGKIKAKIPVISVETTNKGYGEKTKVKKISPEKAEKQAKKDAKKYEKGENPADYIHQAAKIYKDKGNYLIIYEYQNSVIKAVIKPQ